jgi:hypothetical protein
MANILEFLRNVLTDYDAQGAYRDDPASYLRSSGFGDLTGEDVVEGVAVLRGSLPEHVAAGLEPFAQRQGLPLVGPEGGESELDAAVRVLGFAVDRVPTPEPPVIAVPPAPPSWPEPEHEPEPVSAFPDAPPSPDSFPAEVSFPSASSPESQATQESSDAAIPASVSAVTFDLSSLPSVQAFAASLELVATEARQRHDELNRQFNEASMQHAREVADRFAEVLPGIHSELEALRSAAQAGAAQIQADAEADREASRALRESSQAEADAVLDQARREAEHIIASARAEGDAGRQELASRRAELREAEEQLRERLSGIDSLFRRVLSDEGDPSGPPS